MKTWKYLPEPEHSYSPAVLGPCTLPDSLLDSIECGYAKVSGDEERVHCVAGYWLHVYDVFGPMFVEAVIKTANNPHLGDPSRYAREVRTYLQMKGGPYDLPVIYRENMAIPIGIEAYESMRDPFTFLTCRKCGEVEGLPCDQSVRDFGCFEVENIIVRGMDYHAVCLCGSHQVVQEIDEGSEPD